MADWPAGRYIMLLVDCNINAVDDGKTLNKNFSFINIILIFFYYA